MIGQYLSNTNEIDTIHILQNILELNKSQVARSKRIYSEPVRCGDVRSDGDATRLDRSDQGSPCRDFFSFAQLVFQ
jgi:hypothetical protein